MQHQPHQPPRPGMRPVVIVLIVLGVLGILGCGAIGVLAALIGPVVLQARGAAMKTACQQNLKQLGMVAKLYADDWGGLPPKAQWSDALLLYSAKELFQCPLAVSDGSTNRSDYAFNSWLDARSSANVADSTQTPLIFESSGEGWNVSDDLRSFVTRHQRPSGAVGNVVFVDGRVQSLAAAPAATAGLDTEP